MRMSEEDMVKLEKKRETLGRKLLACIKETGKEYTVADLRTAVRYGCDEDEGRKNPVLIHPSKRMPLPEELKDAEWTWIVIAVDRDGVAVHLRGPFTGRWNGVKQEAQIFSRQPNGNKKMVSGTFVKVSEDQSFDYKE